jgi:hypothetical protein
MYFAKGNERKCEVVAAVRPSGSHLKTLTADQAGMHVLQQQIPMRQLRLQDLVNFTNIMRRPLLSTISTQWGRCLREGGALPVPQARRLPTLTLTGIFTDVGLVVYFFRLLETTCALCNCRLAC